MEFEVDKEVNITYIYIGMKKPHTPYRPTFYEIMTNDLDVLELWFRVRDEDDISDGWSMFISTKEKYRMIDKTCKIPHFP